MDYSGTSLNENMYHRYWYGVVWVAGSEYMQMKREIEDSKEFALLEQKSFAALKSKFYAKEKMKSSIKEMR